MNRAKNFQDFLIQLCQYWVDHGCIWSQPYDAAMGAGTFHPHTFLRGLGPEPWKAVYIQPCRRPVDGRYGKSPYRFQHYYQVQVLLKPSPSNIIDIFLNSLTHVGIDLKKNDIGLLEDDWKGPTLGAWGLGWEVRANGQEVTQFTYFQQLGGIDIQVVCGEITYGAERLFMYANGYKNALDIPFNNNFTYGDIFYQNEYEFSFFNFKEADTKQLFSHFDYCENKVAELCEKDLVLPAYDYVLQASHSFNILDARSAISVSERQRFIGRVRDCAKKCALGYLNERKKLNFPLKDRLETDARLPILSVTSDVVNTEIADKKLIFDDKVDFKEKEHVNVLFELGVEEIPPTFQISARREIKEKFENFLEHQKMQFKADKDFLLVLDNINYEVHCSSRRLALIIRQIPVFERKQTQEIWGPAERISKNSDGSLTAAAIGFCKKNNLNINDLSFKQRDDGVFLFGIKSIEPQNFIDKISSEFKDWCYNLNAPLKMRWLPSDLSPSFIRPVRWIVAMVENKIIPLNMFGLESSNLTCGQRILSPKSIELNHVNDYKKILEENFVEISFEKRKEKILFHAQELSKKLGGQLNEDESLLEKCACLSENPSVFFAQFSDDYLRLPEHLIVTVLKEHMSYFTIYGENKSGLLPYYIGVANYKCADESAMIEGTKTVVTGRLDDGTFYYDSDLLTSLPALREELTSLSFQENMGNMLEKTERIQKLSALLYKSSPVYQAKLAELLNTAASFCKADLKSGCVLEFPDEMQGVMGGILAAHQNIANNKQHSELVGQYIQDHYLPSSAGSPMPRSQEAAILSLADKLDSLCLYLANGLEPKGNKDPLGLRRLALSVGRLLGLKKEPHAVNISIDTAVSLCVNTLKEFSMLEHSAISEKTSDFISERIKSYLKENYDARFVEAIKKHVTKMPLSYVLILIELLNKKMIENKNVLIEITCSYMRARNLTHKVLTTVDINKQVLRQKEEINLYDILLQVKQNNDEFYKVGNFNAALNELEKLSAPMETFFNSVMVNDPDNTIKLNRIALVMLARVVFEDFIDFSYLQV